MRNGFFHPAHPLTKLFLVLFLMITCYLILFGLGILLAMPIFNVPAGEVISIIEKIDYEGNTALLKMMQVLYSSGLFLVPALLASFLIGERTGDYLFAKTCPDLRVVLLITLLTFTIITFINYAPFLNEKLVLPERWNGLMERIIENDKNQWNMMKAFLDTDRTSGILFNLFMIALVPAVGEELLFRGVLQRILSEWFRNQHVAIWVVACLFSLMHYQFMGFIPRIILGAMFGYLFIWTASIWVPVIAHFINNGMAVVYYYLYYRGMFSQDPDSIGLNKNMLMFVMFSTIISFIILMMVRKYGKGSADSQLL